MFGLCSQVGDEESREQLIKTHYMARVGELTTQLQISDSKAVHFHSEVKLLQQSVSLSSLFLSAESFSKAELSAPVLPNHQYETHLSSFSFVLFFSL